MLDLIRSTFIDEVCHLPITLQLLRFYLSPLMRLALSWLVSFGLFWFSRQKRRCYLANTGRLISQRNYNVLLFCAHALRFQFW